MKIKRLLLSIIVVFFSLGMLPLITVGQVQNTTSQTEEDYLRIIRADRQTNNINYDDVLKAREQTMKAFQQKSATALDLSWEEMGPDNAASRTRSIIIDNTNTSVIYCGAVTGGIWKSTNGGSSWHQVMVEGSLNTVPNVTCMVQGSNGVIYAGTGEAFYSGTGTGKGGLIGRGLFKSTDGNNFTLVPGTEPDINDVNHNWAYINKLAMDQNDVLFAATSSGLKYSSDEGLTWNYAKAGALNLAQRAWDVKIGSSGIIVACVGNSCYISENGASDGFVSHSTGGNGNLPLPNVVGRIELAIAPSDNNILYAAVATANGNLDNIYRSADKGNVWQVIGPGGSVNFNVFNLFSLTTAGQGIYSNTLNVFPDNPNRILLGGINMWEGIKLDNGFFSWEQISEGLIYMPFYALYIHTNHHQYVFHPTMPNVIYIATDGGVFRSNDGAVTFQGISRSLNTTQCYTVEPTYKGQVLIGTQGSGVQYIDLEGTNLQEGTALTGTAFNTSISYPSVGGYCAASLINPKCFILGTNNGAAQRSVESGSNLASFYSTSMSTIAGSFVTPLLLWENFYDVNSVDTVLFISYDTIEHDESFIAKSATGDYPFVSTNTGPTIFPHDSIYVWDPVQTKLFVGATGGVWYTKKPLDFTVSAPAWVKLSTFSGIVQTMALTKDADVLYVGTQDSLVYRISNILSYASDTSSNVQTDIIFTLHGRAITSLAVDPNDNDRLVVTCGNYGNTDFVYFSNNATDVSPTFTSKQGTGLPEMPVYASLIEMGDPDRVLIGTDMGVFATDNINASNPVWDAESEGLGDVPVMMLKQQTRYWWPIMVEGDTAHVQNYGAIYAATQGRGVFRCDQFVGITDPPAVAETTDESLTIYPNPVQNQASFTVSLDKPGDVHVQLINMTGQMINDMLIAGQPTGSHTYTLYVDLVPAGTYMLQVRTGNTVKTGKLVILQK